MVVMVTGYSRVGGLIGTSAAPPRRCPICLENEDVYGKAGMCRKCGQYYCGDCIMTEKLPRCCPTCRADSFASDEVNFQWLQEMLKRSPGRHTSNAQNILGTMYNSGRGVTQNHQEAVKWYRLAADQGDALAQCNLAHMYKRGEGVTKNPTEAVKWYRLAADQGHADAQRNLGIMHRQGKGVAQNHEEAVKWYRLAADQGDAAAQYNLGYMYEDGEGVAQNHEEAVKWFRLAADQGDAKAQYNLGCMYGTGQGVELDLDQAEHWFKLAADQGYATAQQALLQVAAARAASTTITTATQP